MIAHTIRTLILRELRAVRREIEAYPADADVWAVPPGVTNSAGTLALHLAGNLQHFIGARLGGTGYVRNRDREFSRRDVSRAELLEGLDAATRAVNETFARMSDAELAKPYPEELLKATVPTGEFLIHLAVHLGYHLGQIDYHRRLVTGDAKTLDAVSLREMPSTAEYMVVTPGAK
jgi:uncharacterized damage-inducible protein DinB